MRRTWWWAAVVATLPMLALGYVLRLALGGIAAGTGHVAARLKYMAMPTAYSLRRAQGFNRICGAWVKPRPKNRRRDAGFVEEDFLTGAVVVVALWAVLCLAREFVVVLLRRRWRP